MLKYAKRGQLLDSYFRLLGMELQGFYHPYIAAPMAGIAFGLADRPKTILVVERFCCIHILQGLEIHFRVAEFNCLLQA